MRQISHKILKCNFYIFDSYFIPTFIIKKKYFREWSGLLRALCFCISIFRYRSPSFHMQNEINIKMREVLQSKYVRTSTCFDPLITTSTHKTCILDQLDTLRCLIQNFDGSLTSWFLPTSQLRTFSDGIKLILFNRIYWTAIILHIMHVIKRNHFFKIC